ncbi:Ion trans 2 domain containing protein [Trichuris trichiura]|uniref:Ion trans 2 domain containing protein n=1 Tax=Trichuris trichiura TaxID=36087 RepID=A0A077ZF08_TRITR|nr:Ion trans 2 domain containing protein [Trichuris trichiura]
MASRRRRSKVLRLTLLVKKGIAFLFSHIGLCALVVAYTMLGSVLFRAVEGPLEKEVRQLARDCRHQSVRRLWMITYEYNLYEDEWIDKVLDELLNFKRTLLGAVWKGYDARDYEENVQWTFSGAFLYSLSVITTIGYGNIACRTYFGKAATIGYAIIGIPLMLLFLTNIGDILAKMFRFLYRRAYRLKVEMSLWQKRRKADRLRQIANSTVHGGVVLSRTPSPRPRQQHKVKRIHTFTAKDCHRYGSYKDNLRTAPRSSSLSEDQLSIARQQHAKMKGTAVCDAAPNCLVSLPQHVTRHVDLEGMRLEALIQRYEFEEFIIRESMEEKLNRVLVPLWLVLLTMLAYLSVGAVLFAVWERWDLLDSFYFCFVSLATIGFGDLFPGASVRDDGSAQEKLVITSLYLLFGMALIAMCFNLAQEEVVSKVVHLVSKLGFWKSDSFEAS